MYTINHRTSLLASSTCTPSGFPQRWLPTAPYCCCSLLLLLSAADTCLFFLRAGISSIYSWRRIRFLSASPVPPRPPPKQQQQRAPSPMQTAKHQHSSQQQQHLQPTALHQADQPMASRSAISVAAKAIRGTAASSPSASAASSLGTLQASATAHAGSAGL